MDAAVRDAEPFHCPDVAHFMHREAGHEDRGEFPAPGIGVGCERPREERLAQLQAL